MKIQPLFTAGYSGCDPDTFLDKLRRHDVEILVDVRQRPISRKRGFSKSVLQEFIESNGISYLHQQEFGVPSDLRQQLRDGGSLGAYFGSFRQYLKTQQEALLSLYELAKKKRCCLMCLEAEPGECHRSVVAESVLAQNGKLLEVRHI